MSNLVLTRRAGESVIIGPSTTEVTVTVLGMKGGQARLGFKADPSTLIDREEIKARKDAGLNPGDKDPLDGVSNAECRAEFRKLVEFFRKEGDPLGRKGDSNQWTPVETAIHAMRHLMTLGKDSGVV